MVEEPETLTSGFANFVLSPDEAAKKLKEIFGDKEEELVKQFRSLERQLEYANFLISRFEQTNDEQSGLEIAYSYLRYQYVIIMFMEMNWYLGKLEDESLRDGALLCSRNLCAAAMSDLFTPQTESPNATRYFRTEQAAGMREARSLSDREQAIRAAIEAELAGRVVDHPYQAGGRHA